MIRFITTVESKINALKLVEIARRVGREFSGKSPHSKTARHHLTLRCFVPQNPILLSNSSSLSIHASPLPTPNPLQILLPKFPLPHHLQLQPSPFPSLLLLMLNFSLAIFLLANHPWTNVRRSCLNKIQWSLW